MNKDKENMERKNTDINEGKILGKFIDIIDKKIEQIKQIADLFFKYRFYIAFIIFYRLKIANNC